MLCADSLAFDRAGNSMLANNPIMAMTVTRKDPCSVINGQQGGNPSSLKGAFDNKSGMKGNLEYNALKLEESFLPGDTS